MSSSTNPPLPLSAKIFRGIVCLALVGAGIGVVISVIADVLRTFGDGWLTSSREFRDGVWIVHDNLAYSLGETAQNVAMFSKVLGVLLAFVALVLILLRAMRKTLVTH